MQTPATLMSVACVALFCAASSGHIRAASISSQRHTGTVDGPLLVIDQQGERSSQVQIGTGRDEVLALQGGAVRVLARGLTVPCCGIGGLAASPRGRYVAFSQEASAQPARTEGLWLMTSTGTALHRLLLPPMSTNLGEPVDIGPVAWSPDRYTLAYAVNSSAAGRAARGLGLWLTRYDTPQPRLAVTLAQLDQALPSPQGPFRSYALPITALSWTDTGQTLVVSVQYPAANTAGFSTAVVAVDSGSGRSRTVVMGGEDAVYAQTRTQAMPLAYVTGTANGTTLWIADALGRHARAIATEQGGQGRISSPVWSPDGQSIAYVAGTPHRGITKIRVVEIATGRNRTVLAANKAGLPTSGYFVRLAWMHAPA